MSRTVKVMITDGASSIHELTNQVSTWGEVKNNMRTLGLQTENIKGVVRQSKISLEDDGAQLPEGDLVIFITPLKVKSGKPNTPSKKATAEIKAKYMPKVNSIYRLLLAEKKK